jgi:hypothetical protein
MGDVYRNLAEQLTVKERVHIPDKEERISEILWKRAVYGSSTAKVPTNRGGASPSNRGYSSANSSSGAGGSSSGAGGSAGSGSNGGTASGSGGGGSSGPPINADLMDRGAFKVALELMLGEEYVM